MSLFILKEFYNIVTLSFLLNLVMEWWRIVYVATLILYLGYLIYSFFNNSLSWNVIPTGIVLVSLFWLIYKKK